MKLRIQGVGKEFAGRDTRRSFAALAGVDLDVREGELLTLVGPSGCGKSTLLDLIAGLAAPTAGRILLDGIPLEGPGLDRGVVLRQYALFPWRTALSNIEFALEGRAATRRERADLAREYLDLVGLGGLGDRYPHELAHGMPQRVAIARSLATDPALLLLDEPFAALDAGTRESLQEELLRIWQKTGTTLLFATRSLDEAVCLGRRVAVMTARPGRIRGVVEVDLGAREGDPRGGSRFGEHRHEVWRLLRSDIDHDQKAPVAS
ncbi:ABC transporter ATP-binding protein [Streptosporangium sp. NPDC000563]|uniref:ABC transporter ATP-binding protein n=1 Tax=unclassified Streptosporangium TaxID=2632669 RepID=UPI003318D2AF